MSPADPVRARLSRLLVEVRQERAALAGAVAVIARYREGLKGAPEPPDLSVIAVELHRYFTAAETLFERIAREVDGALPQGLEWHRELVDQMAADLPPVRGAVIDESQRLWLHQLRAFRHFFRHAYAVTLDPRHLGEHADAVLERHREFAGALDAFFDFVRRARDGLPID